MTKLTSIEGIGESYGKKLVKAGVRSQHALLERGSTPGGRREIAEATGISEKLVLRWVNQADLSRIKGVSEEYSDLLEAAGVDTVPELAQRNPENLHKGLEAANSEKKLVRKMPALSQVENWIRQAKRLPRIISY